jgi:hypothetical protein
MENNMFKMKFIEDFQFNHFWQKRFFEDASNRQYFNLDTFNKLSNDRFNIFKFVEHDFTREFTDDSYYFPVFAVLNQQKEQIKQVTEYIKANRTLFEEKKLIPIIFDPLEGHVWMPNLISQLADEVKDICRIYYVDGNKKNEGHEKFTFYYSNMWMYTIADMIPEIKVRNRYDPMQLTLSEDHKIFICLNRLAREHRVRLVSSLIDNDVRKHGYISWTGQPGMHDWQEKFPNVANETFDTLDVVNIFEENPTNKFPTEFCKETFIFLNTETLFDNKTMFLSEKSFKPMVLGMPFILLGNPGILEFLRSFGFKTFDKWVDESYDFDIDLTDRCNIIAKEIDRFSKMTSDERMKIRQEMHEITQHNLQTLQELAKKSDIYDILLDIKLKALSTT